MKLRLLLIPVLALVLGFNTVADKVPEEVKKAFASKYPEVKKVKWKMENGNYEAEFKVNKLKHSAVFTPAGALFESEEEIQPARLPKPAIDYIKLNYLGKKIKEASKVTDASGNVMYEVEVGGKELLFDQYGRFRKVLED